MSCVPRRKQGVPNAAANEVSLLLTAGLASSILGDDQTAVDAASPPKNEADLRWLVEEIGDALFQDGSQDPLPLPTVAAYGFVLRMP